MQSTSAPPKVIYLYLVTEKIMIWNPDDWLELRKKHRIVGALIGSIPRAPYQNVMKGLPAEYLPEEAAILIKRGICKLVCNVGCLNPSPSRIAVMKEFNERVLQEQVDFIKSDRKMQIRQHLDRIVEGKMRKLQAEAANKGENVVAQVNRDEILMKELKKVDKSVLNHHLSVTFVEDPFKKPEDLKPVSFNNFPSNETENLRYQIFEDLWNKGYYLTCGSKFGGDYLVYPGDPLLYHAHFLVLCVLQDSMSWIDIAAHARVATNAKKTLVLASVISDTINYKSIQFENFTSSIFK